MFTQNSVWPVETAQNSRIFLRIQRPSTLKREDDKIAGLTGLTASYDRTMNVKKGSDAENLLTALIPHTVTAVGN